MRRRGGGAGADPAARTRRARAPVVLDGRVLFAVGEADAWSPAQLGARASRSLRAAAESAEPIHLELAERDGYPVVRMGGKLAPAHRRQRRAARHGPVRPGRARGCEHRRRRPTARATRRRGGTYRAAAAARVCAAVLLATLLRWALRVAGQRLRQRLAHARAGGQPAWRTAVELVALALQAALYKDRRRGGTPARSFRPRATCAGASASGSAPACRRRC
ncbi:MAG: hypothetical protein U0802_01730 [Candidatus Binatia bacterium]